MFHTIFECRLLRNPQNMNMEKCCVHFSLVMQNRVHVSLNSSNELCVVSKPKNQFNFFALVGDEFESP